MVQAIKPGSPTRLLPLARRLYHLQACTTHPSIPGGSLYKNKSGSHGTSQTTLAAARQNLQADTHQIIYARVTAAVEPVAYQHINCIDWQTLSLDITTTLARRPMRFVPTRAGFIVAAKPVGPCVEGAQV